MYGTVARIKVKPDGYKKMKEWANDRNVGDTEGGVASYVFRMDDDPSEAYLVAIFEDRETYVANAERPETHQGYLELMESLEAEPEWHDGEIIWSEQA